ncbi:MAG: septal ring lytic transglycosylase RlpA family protein [Pseudomonadota bacterium]|nr:septal ring lytic transglycosylase RlpA family protein [Pseudomonadota bacterium]
MNITRALTAPLGLAVAVGLSACLGASSRTDSNPGSPTAPVLVTPPLPDAVPDAMPRIEKRSRNGNPPFYEVFGKRYFVLSSSVGYVERGVASWYGPGFHKVRTSTGESYDMYGMTAAHKTLPLPAYVRVTNLQNGRSVVVRVNDRGPFVGNRIIDLSYTAALKLDMLHNGTAIVEVRTIEPTLAQQIITASLSPVGVASAPLAPPAASGPAALAPAPPAAASTAASDALAPPAAASSLFIQAGAFSDPANAQRLAEKLRGGNYGKIFVRDDQIAGRRMYRVRIGPVPDVAHFDHIVAALEQAGVHDAHLALD